MSTDVGGVSEILPPDHWTLVEPEINSIINKLSELIESKNFQIKKDSRTIIKNIFNW